MNRWIAFIGTILLLAWPAPAHAGFLAPLIPIVAGLITKSVVLKLAITLVATVALSALQQALKKKPRPPGISIEQTLTGGANSRTFIAGLYCTAGSAVCPPMSHGQDGETPNAYLTQVIAISDLPIDGLQSLIVNGEYVAIGGAPTEYGIPIHGKYSGYGWIKFYDGTQTTADSMLVSKYASFVRPWTANHIGKGVAYAILTWKYNPEIFKGEPTVKFVVRGAKLYDVRKDSTMGGTGSHRWDDPSTWEYTTNNAVIIYNILRGITFADGTKWGGECAEEDLPLLNWVAAMNVCDESVDLAGGGIEPRYRCGYEIKVAEDEPAEIIEEFIKACSGAITEVGGVYKMRAGGPNLPVAFFTDDDFIVSKPSDYDPFPALNGSHNGIFATFPHPEEEWNVHDAPSIIDNDYLEQDNGIETFAGIALPTVPYPVQVQRLMRAWLDDDRRWRRHSSSLGPYTFTLEPMDTIAWTSARNGYDEKIFEISDIVENPMTLINAASMREVDPDDYDWNTGKQLPDPVTPGQWDLPETQSVPGFAVEAYAITDEDSGARRPAIRASWTPNGAEDASALKIQVRVKITETFVADVTVARVQDGETIITEGVLPNIIYQVRARYQVDRPTEWTSWLDVTTENILISGVEIDGFAQLESDVQTALESVGTMEGIIDDLVLEIGEVGGTVDTLVSTVATQGSEITENATAISTIVGDMATLDIRVTVGEAAQMPERYTSGQETNFHAEVNGTNIGAPTDLSPTLSNYALTGYGAVYKHELETDTYFDFMTRGVLLATAGKTYEVEIEVVASNVTGQVRIHAGLRGLDEDYASVGVTTKTTGVIPGDGTYIVTARFSSAAGDGVLAWPSGAVWLRPVLRVWGVSPSGACTAVVKRLRVRDVSANQNLTATVNTQAVAVSNLTSGMASLTQSVSIAAATLNANSTFTDWAVGEDLPVGYQPYGSPPPAAGSYSKVAGNYGNAIRLTNTLPTTGDRIGFWTNPVHLPMTNAGPGYYRIECEITLESGSLIGSGMTLIGYDASGSYVSGNLHALTFSTDPDSTGAVVGAGTVGKTYRFSKLVRITSPTVARLRLEGDNFYASPHGGALTAKSITWHRIAAYAANASDVGVTTNAQAIQTLDGQYSSLSSTVSTQGVTISSHTSAISTINGNVTTLLGRWGVEIDVNGYVSGIVTNNNGSRSDFTVRTDKFSVVAPGGGARTEYSNGNWRVYDSSGVLRVRLGVW